MFITCFAPLQPTFTFDPSYKNPCWKETGAVHCLPYFFLIGVKKCGTSELWRNIATHPEIVKGNFGKEAQWFARKRFNKWGCKLTDCCISNLHVNGN